MFKYFGNYGANSYTSKVIIYRCTCDWTFVIAAGGRGPDELNQVMLPIIDRETCNQPNWYDGAIDDSMVCAGYAHGGRDTCQVISQYSISEVNKYTAQGRAYNQ